MDQEHIDRLHELIELDINNQLPAHMRRELEDLQDEWNYWDRMRCQRLSASMNMHDD